MSLEQRIADVLARLSALSEAPASRPSDMATAAEIRKDEHDASDRFGKQPKRHHESSIPGGVDHDLPRSDPASPPPKDRSLYDWYLWQFRHAEPHKLETLCELAEIECDERCFRSPDRINLRSGELTDNDAQDGGAAERAAAERVIEWYEGHSAMRVAVLENTTEMWVLKARRQHGRNPIDGRPRPEFKSWDEDRRRREVEALAREHGQKVTADRLGVSKRTVQRYWPASELAAAA